MSTNIQIIKTSLLFAINAPHFVIFMEMGRLLSCVFNISVCRKLLTFALTHLHHLLLSSYEKTLIYNFNKM
jgi:hypothetical protein